MSTITLKGIIDEDFVNYKVPSMSLMFPQCSFKCGEDNCQNRSLKDEPDVSIEIDDLCMRYINNPITEAIVCQGLEPIDSFKELLQFIKTLRYKYHCFDDFVIYTGYSEDEIQFEITTLRYFPPVIMKFGRYISGDEAHFDDILGVNLISDNQYGVRLE